MAAHAISPSKNLTGMLLPGGWKVIQLVPKNPRATGGWFSQGYIVQAENGGKAFLKAIDYEDAAAAPDPALQIKAMTDTYVFERELLSKCRDSNLDRVVRAIASGNVGSSPNDLVLYLIFELADGDVRQHLFAAHQIDLAWRLRVLHQTATGLRQLHSQGIAHQDIKPSNILVFARVGSKIADLGRAAAVGYNPPHDGFEVPGDHGYASPELLYHLVLPDWKARRLGCDLYLLGSMIVYLFTGHGMTPLLVRHLSPVHPPASGGDRMRMSCRTFATRSTTRSTSSRQVCPST